MPLAFVNPELVPLAFANPELVAVLATTGRTISVFGFSFPFIDVSLWVLVVLVFGVGDAVTTIVGIHRYGLVEANPLAVRLVGREPTVRATLVFKTGAFLVGLACYLAVRVLANPLVALGVPLLLLFHGAMAVQTNLLNMWLVADPPARSVSDESESGR